MLSRSDDEPGIACVELAEVRGCPDVRIERYAGKEERILVPFVDRSDDFRLQRPQQGLSPARGGDLRQRCAPGAATDYAELHVLPQ